MEPTHVGETHGWHEAPTDAQDRVRIAGRSGVAKKHDTLNIWRSVPPPITADTPPLPKSVAALHGALAKCRQAEDEWRRVMVEGGLLQ